jgi:uncharacterized repeat protein (TIGR01451 family)
MPAETRSSLPDVVHGRRRFLAIFTIVAQIAAALTALLLVAAPAQAGPSAVMFGYVPLPANDFQGALKAINAGAGSTLDYTVGITNAAAGAVITYDQWEDGYETDISNPTQSTTLVFGDGNTANGDAATYCGAVCAGDVLPQGAALVLRNNIPTPRDSSTQLFDGGDKVASTRGFTITAGGFTTSIGSVLAGVVSSYDTTKYATDYTSPVGENTTVPSGTSNAFGYTGLIIQASSDGTTVSVDKDANGTTDVTQTINEGKTVFVNGGVKEGATVHASAPVQVHLVTGDKTASYESRTFTLFPDNLLSNDYLSPAGSSVNNFRTINYLYNPSGSSLTVTPTCTGCSGTISVPSKASTAFASPVGQAVEFKSASTKFIAIAGVGAQSGALPGGSGDSSSSWDWGFTMIPMSQLTTQVVLGWAPGNSNNPPSSPVGDMNDNPVWVTSTAATTINVDFDGDPSTGAISSSDCFGGHHDQSISVAALASTRIFDANDGDMTGARIYTCDGTLISGAWGEDPQNAPTGSPGFDAGYTIIPSTTMLVNKTSALATDANNDGKFGPGDTMTYDIAIADAGSLAFTNVKADDVLPSGLTYVPGSTVFDDGTTQTPLADDASPPAATAFPLDEAGTSVPNISAGATVHVRFKAQIKDPFDSSGAVIGNNACVTAQEASACDSVTTSLVQADLSLNVTQTGTPQYVGDQAVFHVAVTNGGPDTATNVDVIDGLPGNTTYVSSSASQGSYDHTSGVWNVGTVANGETKTLDITATVGALSVEDFAEVTAAQAVDPDSQPAEDQLGPGHPANQDDEGSVVVTVGPSADLSITKTLQTTPVHLGDNAVYDITVSNAGPSDATGVAVTDQLPSGLTYVSDNGGGTYDSSTGVWTVGSVSSGGSKSLLITAQVNALSTDNVATISASDQHDPDGTNNTSDRPVSVQPLADLSLAASVSPTSVNQGGQATYTLTLHNAGPSDATGIVVTNALPAGVTFVSGSSSQPSVFDMNTGHWSIASLPSGASISQNLVVNVDTVGSHVDAAEVTAVNEDDPDSTPNNHVSTEDDQASADVAGDPVIDLSVSDTSSAPAANVGTNVTYTVTVSNGGPSGATGVSLRDALPNGVTYVSNNATSGSYDSSTGIWTAGAVANGSSETLHIVGRIDTSGVVDNFAEVVAANETDTDSQPAENSLNALNPPDQDDEAFVAVTGVQIDVSLGMTSNVSSVEVGKNVTYTISVANNGPSDATGVSVKDLVPTGMAFVSAAPGQGSFNAVTGVWNVGNVAVGQTVTAGITMSAQKAGAIVDTAQVWAANEPDVDSTPANSVGAEDDQASVTVDATAPVTPPSAPKADPASVSGSLWLDKNADGKADPDEPMLAGVTVQLIDAHGHIVATAVTDAAGHYSFTNIAPGTYTISVVRSTLPPAAGKVTYDPDSVMNGQSTITLKSGAGVGGMNFAFDPPAAPLTLGPVKLPITGANLELLGEIAAALLLAGACMIGVTRRRKRDPAA